MTVRLDRNARLVRRALIAIVLLLAAYGALFDTETPRPGPEERRRAPDGERYVDVSVPVPPVGGEVRFEPDRDAPGQVYVGTAFATQADAVWATARHVAEGCRRTELRHGGGTVQVTDIVHDRAADLSLLHAPTGGHVAPATDAVLPLSDRDLDGFGMGYPGGGAASVHLGYLGRVAAVYSESPVRARRATAGIWQIRRSGLFDQPELGGISGGPLFDRQGGLIGIIIGGQPRRARAISLDPVNLTAFMVAAGSTPARPGWRHAAIGPDNADTVRSDLVRNGLLALVVCQT